MPLKQELLLLLAMAALAFAYAWKDPSWRGALRGGITLAVFIVMNLLITGTDRAFVLFQSAKITITAAIGFLLGVVISHSFNRKR